jgi:radical SAM superfamily enzyme YgiQ (UPF0313 family)
MRVQLVRYQDLANINTRLAQSLNKHQGVLPPLGIAYIASSLEKANHDVDIIDAIALKMSRDQVRRRIREFHPDVVGITAMTPTFPGAKEAAWLAKQEGAITVMGGVHMAIFAEETLSYDYVDFGVIGEAEETIVELCAAIENKQPFEPIKGLAFKKDGKIIAGRPRIIEDLDSLPMPAYHLLPMDKYSSIIGLHPVSTMMASRGCPYRCGFCYKTPSDVKHRYRNYAQVADEMEFLIKNYRVKEIMFYDDLMMPQFVENLCNEILKRKLKIAWQSPQRVNLVTFPLLKLMKKAGCRMLRYGIEQGDPEMMRLIEKNITLQGAKDALRWTHQAGIETFTYYIIGYPGENERTVRATINLAKELDSRYAMFTKAVPLPGTKLMESAAGKGLVEQDYWRKFILGQNVKPLPDFIPGTEKWVERAYKEFYLRPAKIIKQIASIRGWEDIKKSIAGFMGLVNFKMRE